MSARSGAAVAVLLWVSGCSTTRGAATPVMESPIVAEERPRPPSEPDVDVVVAVPHEQLATTANALLVDVARRLVGERSLRAASGRFPDDCSGFVRYVYDRAGISLLREHPEVRRSDNAVTAIHREARRRRALHARAPLPGDLVFFRETYDRNHDGAEDDGLTHIGIVETVDERGTVTFIHRGSRGITRAVLTPSRPSDARGERGQRLNDVLRPSGDEGPALTGELFVGYASAHAWRTP